MKKQTLKKIGKWIGDVFLALFVCLMLFITVTNLKAKSSNNIPNLFGTGYLAVLSDSMDGDNKDSFKKGDLIIVKVYSNDKDKNNLKVGDIITYYSWQYEKIISHRIVEITESSINAGTYIYSVQGDNALSTESDIESVQTSSIYAVYKGKVAGLGTVTNFFSSGVGFFIIVVLPCAIFLVYEIYKFVIALIAYQNEKKGITATAGVGVTNNDQLIALRKEALDQLVSEGVLTQDQATSQLDKYIASLSMPKDEVIEATEVKDESDTNTPQDENITKSEDKQ